MLKILFPYFLMLTLFGCQQKEEFTVEDIAIPKYYHHYYPRKFWKSMGARYFHPQEKDSLVGKYKDSLSLNFLDVGESYVEIMRVSQKERIDYFKSEYPNLIYSLNKDFEIYKSSDSSWINKRLLHYISYQFIIKKDSVSLGLTYSTFDKNPQKLKDYFNIIDSIKSKCRNGVVFKSLKNKIPRQKQKIAIN